MAVQPPINASRALLDTGGGVVAHVDTSIFDALTWQIWSKDPNDTRSGLGLNV